jgi:hypothetical protein
VVTRADTRPVIAPPYAFYPHPTAKGQWIRTDICVALRDCPHCKAKRDELCKNDPGEEHGTACPHISRKKMGHRLKMPLMVKLAKSKDYRFPGAAWYVAREFEQTGFRVTPFPKDDGEED